MMKISAIAVLSTLLFFPSSVTSSEIHANSIVERNSGLETQHGVYTETFKQREADVKSNKALNYQSDEPECADRFADRTTDSVEAIVVPILPRATSTSISSILVVGTSSEPTSASFPSSSSSPRGIECFCSESGCSPESPPCCADGSCAVSRVKSGSDGGLKIRLSMYIGLFSVVVACLMS